MVEPKKATNNTGLVLLALLVLYLLFLNLFPAREPIRNTEGWCDTAAVDNGLPWFGGNDGSDMPAECADR